MPATTTTRELFAKATTALADLQAERDLKIQAGAIRSTIDDTSDPDNYILITVWNVLGQNDDPGAQTPQLTPAGVNLASIPAARQPMAKKILSAFAVGFGVLQQVAALANAIAESGLDPNARSPAPEDSVGLFQLNRGGGLGAGYGEDELKDPDKNISIIFNEAMNYSAFKNAQTLDDAVAAFVENVERPADPAGEILKRQHIARALYSV